MNLPARRYFIEKEVPLVREKVWELLSDTDHLNRVIGLFAVTSGPAAGGRGGYVRTLSAKVAGLVPLRWNEYPFRWTKNSTYSVIRRYTDGPLKEFRGGVKLTDGDAVLPNGGRSTLVHLFAEFTPRNLIGVAAIPVFGRGSMENTMRYLTDFLALNPEEGVERRPATPPSHRFRESELRLRYELMRNEPVDPTIGELFHAHLEAAGDDEVVDMNPYKLADRWRRDRREVLRWFLYATKAGVTNMSWNLICPNCRVAKVDVTTLANLPDRFHCDFCGIAYAADFDRFVELTFTVHPNVRVAENATYCVGGPTITPHIYVQSVVESGSEDVVDVPEEPEEYRMRVLRLNQSVSVSRRHGLGTSDEPHLVYSTGGWRPADISIDPSVTQLLVRNESEEDIVVACEKTDWSNDAATAFEVTSMGEFRRMFSSEVLAPGRQIGIENVTILFTDLLGSTEFYETVGDAPAYGQVQRHFAYLGRWIEANRGAVVKTIGDAVMAVFSSPADGLAAALDIQTHIDEFNDAAPGDAGIAVKIGLHCGPAIAVNLNDHLDYFGRTVNIASRVQGKSGGGEVVASSEVAGNDDSAAVIRRFGAAVDPIETPLKGLDGTSLLYRITPA